MKFDAKKWVVPVAIFVVGTAIGAEEQARQDANRPSVVNAVETEKNVCSKECEQDTAAAATVDQARKSGDKAQMKHALDVAYDELNKDKDSAEVSRKRMMALHDRLEAVRSYMDKVKDDHNKMESSLYYTNTSEFYPVQ
jgi:hypothetical protein